MEAVADEGGHVEIERFDDDRVNDRQPSIFKFVTLCFSFDGPLCEVLVVLDRGLPREKVILILIDQTLTSILNLMKTKDTNDTKLLQTFENGIIHSNIFEYTK